MGSPDIPEPTLVLTRLTAGEAGLDSNAVNLRVTTHSGWSCGGTPVTLPYGGLTPGVSLTDDGEPIRLCDAAYSAHHTFANIGSGSGLVVVASVVHEGETYTSRSIVSTDFARCDSSCLADRNRRNTSISLPQLPGVDTCDGPFNEVCRNPIIPRSAGSLGLRIQWNDTEGNGRDHWLVGITTNHVS